MAQRMPLLLAELARRYTAPPRRKKGDDIELPLPEELGTYRNVKKPIAQKKKPLDDAASQREKDLETGRKMRQGFQTLRDLARSAKERR